ncbi:MAG: methyltransferase domain-containing protein [Chitinophagaceae bacterium]|nr:methyltransferase domain-containing protein [Chitinophagaceae bacterium]
MGLLKTDKPVVTYDSEVFPFADKEFDYVVCSHVLEHVDNVDQFLSEVQRVGKRGYLEFPTVYYDYLYNFLYTHNF